MYPEVRDYEVVVSLEPEVSWLDVVPIADELQERGVYIVRVERAGMRVGAGGPGFDIVPIGATFFFGALMAEVVRDVVYPFLKEKLRAIYDKVSRAERAMELKPLAVGLKEAQLTATYRFPPGLSDTEFGSALGSVLTHFATIRGSRHGIVLLDFDSALGNWEINEEGSQFLTANEEQMRQLKGGEQSESHAAPPA